MGGTVLATSVWSMVLLDRVPTWHPELRPAILAAGCMAAVLLVFSSYIGHASRARVAQALALGAAGVAVLAAPAAYTLATVATPHTGAIPSAGPASAAVAGPFGNGGAGFGPGRAGSAGAHRGLPRAEQFPSGRARGGNAFIAPPSGVGAPSGFPAGGQPGGPIPQGGQGGQGGNVGGLLNSSTPSKAITSALKADAAAYTWVAAAVGSNASAGYQLASGEPVMAIGGFNGTDPAPSLAQFEKYVSEDKIHYFIASGGSFGGGPAGSNGASDDASLITSWVESHFTATTIGGVTVYDLATGGR